MSDDNVLINKKEKRLFFYPFEKSDKDYSVPDTVSVIDEEAFANRIHLETVTLPDSVHIQS